MKTKQSSIIILFFLIILIKITIFVESRSLLQSSPDIGSSNQCSVCISLGGRCTYSYSSYPNTTCEYGSDFPWIVYVFDVIWLGIVVVAIIGRYILCPLVIVVFLIYKCSSKRKAAETLGGVQHHRPI